MAFLRFVDRRHLLPAILCLAWAAPALAEESGGPSFDCSRVTSTVNKLICATPELAALDRELAGVFQNMTGQAAFDAKALRREEDAWLADMRNRCTEIGCIRAAYQQRLAVLRERSLRAASPAAYAETKPFPVPAALMEEAQGLVGKACNFGFMKPDPELPGFVPSKGMVPVIDQSFLVVPRDKAGSRFAFLFGTSADDQSCGILDVVALPAPQPGDQFLRCTLDRWDPDHGFGYRRAGHKTVEAYWVIDRKAQKIQRVAIGVLGDPGAVRCTEPEWGE